MTDRLTNQWVAYQKGKTMGIHDDIELLRIQKKDIIMITLL